MIPLFPNFKKLEFSDKEEVESLTHPYPPYSDFNFTSMWCWNVKNAIEISLLKGNLVVKFSDYVTGDPFFSFIGEKDCTETAETLINISKERKIEPILKLIPDVTASRIDFDKFEIVKDPDNFDYILSTNRLRLYEGSQFAKKRTYARRFIKDNHNFTLDYNLDLDDEKIKEEIKRVFLQWIAEKKISVGDMENEYKALMNYLNMPDKKHLVSTGIWVNKCLVAFWLLEDIDHLFAVSHFEKAAIVTYTGINAYFHQQIASELYKNEILYINQEQDLGIPGLRVSKKSFGPLGFLNKFTILNK